MTRLAVDAVLLLAEETNEQAIRLNRGLRNQSEDGIALDRTACVPHVSLAMGCVREDDVPAIAELLEGLALGRPSLNLVFTGLHARTSRSGEWISSLDIAPSPDLRSLHELVMERAAPYFARDAEPDMFVDPPSITESTVWWVSHYHTASSFDRFWPHITLGIGTLPEGTPWPTRGAASKLALCHLGHRCTCQAILFETPLGRARDKRG